MKVAIFLAVVGLCFVAMKIAADKIIKRDENTHGKRSID